MTYVAKASHLAKSLPKPVTMTGTKPALRGYSASIKEWAERKFRHVSASLSFSFSPFFHGSLHPAFHKLCTPIYTRPQLNEFDAISLSSIEGKGVIFSQRTSAFVEVCFNFHAMLQGIDIQKLGRTCLK